MYRKRKSTISRQNMFQHVKRTSNTNNNELIIVDNTYLYGYALLFTTFITFFISVYSIIASKYMPYTGNRLLDWIKQDNYYCLLVPITAIAWIYWILWNWMGMKFFRHN